MPVEYASLSREELVSAIGQMHRELEEFRRMKGELDWTVHSLKDRTRTLNERVKELDCVCRAIRILRREELSFEQRAEGLIALIPPACQHSAHACAHAVVDGREFRTEGYEETRWKLSSGVRAAGRSVGVLELCYRREFPPCHEGPFLREERALLDVLAECLGAAIELRPGPDLSGSQGFLRRLRRLVG